MATTIKYFITHLKLKTTRIYMPKISVIVPAYNVEKYIRRCIDSILSQTFSDFECIIVNDCSPDNSGNICNEYAKKDVRVQVIRKPINEGLPSARKTGFENSCGDFIVNIDSDDWIENNMLEKLYSTIVKEDADLVCCDFYIDSDDKCEHVSNIVDTENYFNNLGFRNYSAVWTYLFKRELYEKIKFPVYAMAEDRVITQQALFYTKKFCKIPLPLYHYRVNAESMMQSSISEKKCFEHQQNIIFVIDFFKNNLGADFCKIEDNINDYVNRFKYSIVSDKNLKSNKKLYKFYPESKFQRYLRKKKLKLIRHSIIPKSVRQWWKCLKHQSH